MTNIPSDKPNRSELHKFILPAIISITSVTVGVLLSQLFLERSSTVNQRIELRKERISAQLPYLQELRRLVSIGQRTTTVIFKSVYVDPTTKKVLGKASEDQSVTVISLAQSIPLQKEWERLSRDIEANAGAIDPDVYENFEAILKMSKANQFPKNQEFQTLSTSGWSTSQLREHWLTMMRILQTRLENKLELAD
jgi:hypothetical protein